MQWHSFNVFQGIPFFSAAKIFDAFYGRQKRATCALQMSTCARDFRTKNLVKLIFWNGQLFWHSREKCARIFVGEIDSCSQFHQHFTRAFFVQKFVQSQNVTRKRRSYKKCAQKTLMKVTPGVLESRYIKYLLWRAYCFDFKEFK